MLNKHFYHKTIRHIVATFGALFNEIYIVHYDDNDNPRETVKVKLAYSPKEKFVYRLFQDPDLNKSVQVSLPRMAYVLNSIEYDPERQLNKNQHNRVYSRDANNNPIMLRQTTGVPYNFDFTLSIYAKNTDDAAQIVEQIIPYFTPEYTVRVNMIPDLGIDQDVTIILNNPDLEVEYEGDFSSTRRITWDLNFTVKSYFYGPIKTQGPIRTANTRLWLQWQAPGDIITVHTTSQKMGKNFKIDEFVYQGDSYANATAKGRYLSLNANNSTENTKTHSIQLLEGKFVNNANVHGTRTNTLEFLNYIDNSDIAYETITVKPDPFDADADDDYRYSTSIVRFGE